MRLTRLIGMSHLHNFNNDEISFYRQLWNVLKGNLRRPLFKNQIIDHYLLKFHIQSYVCYLYCSQVVSRFTELNILFYMCSLLS